MSRNALKHKPLPVLIFILTSGLIYSQVIPVKITGRDNWLGHERIRVDFKGRQAWYVEPVNPAEGNPWIWRAHFPTWHTSIDSILLLKGFHLAYINTNHMFGSPQAMRVWDEFYDYLVNELGLSAQVALEGVSRGGLYVYNWAKRNPSKVSCIYAEAPVCDFKSWPGGRGKSKGDTTQWKNLLSIYDFTEQEAMAYNDNPVNNLEGLASFKVPVIHSICLNDKIVLPEENTYLLVNNYIRLGGTAIIIPMTRGKQSLEGHHFEIEHPDVIADQIYRYCVPVRNFLDAGLYHKYRSNLENSFLKFEINKKGRVVFLGGSITEGPGWRDKVCRYLEERFPETEFDFINAGISSTGSTPGAFRLEKDVLPYGQVDLLFEDAAVNDRTNGFKTECRIRGMEGIIRHALLANPEMDIVLLYFVDPEKMEDYWNHVVPAEIIDFEKVADHYGVSSINLAREVTDRIDAGEFSWEDDFKNLHPSPFGQEIYYQSIRSFLENSWRQADVKENSEDHILPDFIDPFSYWSGHYTDISQARKLQGFKLVGSWHPSDGKATRKRYVDVPMLIGENPGDGFEFEFNGRAIGICVAAGPDAGVIEYSIDGDPFRKLDLFTRWSQNLYIPWYYILDDELSCEPHSLKVRIFKEKNKLSEGNACRIVHFLVNDCD